MNGLRIEAIDGASAELATALREAGLPTDDPQAPGRRFFRFDDAAGAVGFGGLEGEGAHRLLRSMVVLPARRGRGHGAAMLRLLEAAATELGAAELHLLTETADGFFRAQGYAPADRASAPADIAATAQFGSLCPASARYLAKRL